MLAQLYSDDRVREYPEFQNHALYAILENTYLERLLNKKQVEDFTSALSSHHLALLADGNTVLKKSIIEHNLFAAGKIYNNIE